MPTIAHPNGQTTYYEDDNYTDPWKPCETVLIQHGFARHSAFWYHWVPALARHYRIIRRDARGHGRSSTPPPYPEYDCSLETILSEIVDTLDQLGLEKVHFLGESTGGMFGEAMAVKYPGRLLSAATCSTPMVLPQSAQDAIAYGHSSWPAACREMGSRGYAEKAAGTLGADKGEDQAYLRWWIDQVAICSGEGLARHAELLSTMDTRAFVNDIRVPMLILAPSNSSLAKLEGEASQNELHERVPGSKMVVIEGPGHEIYIDSAGKCQDEYVKFLKSLE